MKKGQMIAGAVAAMFAMGAYAADDKAAAAPKKDGKDAAATVKCAGVNECKGHGACSTANNSCAGKNGCKGKGVVSMTEADCKAKKGTVAASK